MDTPNDLISLTEAQKILQTSRNKVGELVRKGLLKQYETPLDRRKKLVSRAEVKALKVPRAA